MSIYCWKFIRVIAFAPAAAIMLAAHSISAQESFTTVQWPNTPTARIEALAILQTLNATLLSNASATLTLDRWCAGHNLAPQGSKIVAQRVRGRDKPVNSRIRELLAVGPDEPIAYRHVRLVCGNRVLSEADNWYVPARLTMDMNKALNTSDVAFGRAVQSLKFTRTNLSSNLLWSPLPEGWDVEKELPTPATGSLILPPFLLEHHAVLKLQDGTPFSALVESYTSNVLDFPPPPLLTH